MNEPRLCEWEECDVTFVPRTRVTRFHSVRCQIANRSRYRPDRRHLKLDDSLCDRCRMPEARGRKIERFRLAHTDRRGSNRSVGVLFLCQPCWSETAGKRRWSPKGINFAKRPERIAA